MTDTTDTEALREQAETAKVCGGMFAISGEQALALLDQLEAERHKGDLWFGKVADLEAALKAERQRADEIPDHVITIVNQQTEILELTDRAEKAEASVGVLEGIIARKEFDALKGDQVPVAVVELNDNLTVAEIRGDIPRRKAVRELYEGALVIGQELFTAPQKPVVLPGISELIDACDCAPAVRDVHVWDLAISEVRRLNPSLFSEKSSAAGIVKDGE